MAGEVIDTIDAQPQEFGAHFQFTDNGLKLYYALDSVRKQHDWDGKPTVEMTTLSRD